MLEYGGFLLRVGVAFPILLEGSVTTALVRRSPVASQNGSVRIVSIKESTASRENYVASESHRASRGLADEFRWGKHAMHCGDIDFTS